MIGISSKRGLKQLEGIGLERRTVFFCSERFPWKCHRRWVAGELVKRGWQVIHIIERGKVWIPRRKHLQCCDDRMDSRGAGRPNSEIFRIADH
jgi:uncharacterized protein (DUF488 family)